MRDDLSAGELAALTKRTLVERSFVWIAAKDRGTGNPVYQGFHNGTRTRAVAVIDALTGLQVTRTFVGAGALRSVGAVPLVADLTIRTVDVILSEIDPTVANLVRGADVRNAPIQIYRGLYDPATRSIVAPPKARFVGFVDGAPIETPAEGSEGGITLHCVSTTRELTRVNPSVRSHASQKARNPADRFYVYTQTAADWPVPWGQVG